MQLESVVYVSKHRFREFTKQTWTSLLFDPLSVTYIFCDANWEFLLVDSACTTKLLPCRDTKCLQKVNMSGESKRSWKPLIYFFLMWTESKVIDSLSKSNRSSSETTTVSKWHYLCAVSNIKKQRLICFSPQCLLCTWVHTPLWLLGFIYIYIYGQQFESMLVGNLWVEGTEEDRDARFSPEIKIRHGRRT